MSLAGTQIVPVSSSTNGFWDKGWCYHTFPIVIYFILFFRWNTKRSCFETEISNLPRMVFETKDWLIRCYHNSSDYLSGAELQRRRTRWGYRYDGISTSKGETNRFKRILPSHEIDERDGNMQSAREDRDEDVALSEAEVVGSTACKQKKIRDLLYEINRNKEYLFSRQSGFRRGRNVNCLILNACDVTP